MASIAPEPTILIRAPIVAALIEMRMPARIDLPGALTA
jgi:hypothetical protein